MNLEEVRRYCLSLNDAEEKMPFDDKTLVFTVKGKMFCATDITTFKFLNLKCDPEEAIVLRERYSDVTPGYYMNKKCWNSVSTSGKISNRQMKEWIFKSYQLVVAGLTKKIKEELARK